MKHLAITGGIATGKSLICKIFETLGASVYYSDVKAKLLMVSNFQIKKELIDYFGEAVYENNELNKVFLANKIFNNEADRRYVDSIVHPVVIDDYLQWRETNSAKFTIMESALVPKLNIENLFDKIITVSSPEAIRVGRIMRRDAVSIDDAMTKIKSQTSEDMYNLISDYIILNDEQTFLTPQVLEIYKGLNL
ncbi:MAG: dephospho-CoA kinase [Bacteroidales bacterium]|nr:dephospho-CoA kinase [Bacteroidales bacterium]